MRVLHIDTGAGWRGGQQQVLWLMLGARERGTLQRLLAPAESPLLARARSAGLDAAELSGSGVSAANWRAARQQARGIDILHAHDAHAHTLACAAQLPAQFSAGPAAGRPVIVVSRRTGFAIRRTGRVKYRVAAHYIAVSEHVRAQLLEAGVPAGKITVIYDGVRPPLLLPGAGQRADFRARQGLEEERFVIGTLSTLAPEKRLTESLSLLSQLPADIHFWIGVPAAEPDPRAEGMRLLEQARSMGLEQRFRLIPVSENPSAFLGSLDLFLYLSRSEGLGSAILMAMAQALPVVASAAGGIPEIVSHLRTGVLVEGGALQGLPEAVLLLKHSPQLRQRLGACARQFVFDHATDVTMTCRTIELYEKLVEQRQAQA